MLRLGVSYRVEELVPHRGAMSLLESIDEYGEDWLRASLMPTTASTFAGPHGMPVWVGLEYMAQACCAFSGIEEAREGRRPSIGLLLGSRAYHAEVELFEVGAKLAVRAELLLRDESDLVAFACTIHHADQVLARGDVKAYRPKDVLALIRGSR